MKTKTRKGFTLVEVISVIAILAIVSTAILGVFQFTTRTFVQSNLRLERQFEARMAMDKVKKVIGVAKNVVISDLIPDTLPSNKGYCYYDQTNHWLRLRTNDGQVYSLMANLPDNLFISIQFVPIKVNDIFNTVGLIWQIGDYPLSTDIFIQNMAVHGGSIATTYTMGDTPLPGIYVEFENP